MIQQMRLDDLLARDIDLRWFEAVALIQVVCRQGLTGSAAAADFANAGFPAAGDIVLDSAGNVTASAMGTGAGAAAAAAHLLAAMVKDDVPVRLRLILTQTTAGIGYSTLAEFSEAISYFERPAGEQVLKALFERANQAPHRIPPPVHEEPARPPEPLPGPELPRRRRGSPLTLAAVVTVLICGFVLWLVGSDARTARVAATLGVTRDASKAPETAAAPSVEKSKRRPDRARSDARTAHRAVETGSVRRSSVAGSPPSHSDAAVTPLVASDVSWIPNLMVTPEPFAAQASTVPPAMVFYSSVEITASAAAAQRDADAADGGRIYSRSDSAVTPPRSIYPKLPDEPPFGPRLANETVLELIINARGLVEHVKLRTPPHNIHEFMIVSAAKTWQFEPARLEGQPVRFRQLIHLIMQ